MSVSIPAGRINKLFGTDGGVMLSLYADFPANFDTDTPLLVIIDALEVPLWCERFERRGASGAVAAFADFDTERRAQELIGFAVTGFEMRHGGTENGGNGGNGGNDDGNNANNDTCNDDGSRGGSNDNANANNDGSDGSDAGDSIKGAAAFTGSVTDYYDSDANPLFELEIGGRTVLVPAAEEFIAHIDFEGRTMKMILPGGLIDL